MFEKNTLGRTAFLLLYTALNVVLYVEAYQRHGASNKGKALRGEPFYLCGLGPCLGSGDNGDANAVRVPAARAPCQLPLTQPSDGARLHCI